MVSKDMPCPICGQQFGEREVLTFTFYQVAHREFEVFDDNAVHQDCLRNWEKKEEFVKFWNSQIRQSHDMFDRDYELLVIQPDGSVRYEKPKAEVKKKRSVFKQIFGGA